MDQQTQAQDADGKSLLEQLMARLSMYGNNASNNMSNAFASMSLQSWIRLTVIVGGYLLLRPYFMKWAGKHAVNTMEEEDAKSRGKSSTDADITPNEFRGIKEKLQAAELGDEGDGTGADWGRKARLRQRQLLKDMLEEEERRRAAENEDADIQEFLED
ncbi:hypothetical protein DCS_05691 [Drechmeria coniospora]|uniref:Uncharacterized protein n=1 Tax=Drechmeria coniospora TaxID=98403 RepID=A0A151GNH6_DRECN|nr:hypothetical protein DCS_05691 [Drechmeria coniospora]KYK58674.1 hypothetical protein DCS_05691 [Drechmeria coniospora]ODA84038.1 hypothetical protein RJ55_02556 [Drechmeria coniospora]